MMNQLEKEVDELSDRIGEFIRYWGFKKIHGKIWCLLFLSNDPMDATQLIEKTGVSKALMSQTLSELLEYKVIISLDSETKRKRRFETNPNILSVITAVLRQRERVLLGDISSYFRSVQSFNQEQLDEVNIDSKKLRNLGKMISFAEGSLCSILRFDAFSFKPFKKIFEEKSH